MLSQVARTLDPLLQIGLLRTAPGETESSGRDVYSDYLSYIVEMLKNEDRFTWNSRETVRDDVSRLLAEANQG